MQVLKMIGYTVAAVLVLAMLLGVGAVVAMIATVVAGLSAVAFVVALIALLIKEIFEGDR